MPSAMRCSRTWKNIAVAKATLRTTTSTFSAGFIFVSPCFQKSNTKQIIQYLMILTRVQNPASAGTIRSMNSSARIKQAILVVGDLVIMVAALAVATYLRGRSPYHELMREIAPWTTVIVGWTILMWYSGLYDVRRLRNDI